MISMLAWGWAGKPVFGAISSSFQTRKRPWPILLGIVVAAEREVVLGLQPAVVGAAEFVANGLSSIMGFLR